MRLSVIAVGRLKDGPERQLVDRYAGRCEQLSRKHGMSGPDRIEIAESRARLAPERKSMEARDILSAGSGMRIVALDERGRSHDSAAFVAMIVRERDAGTARLAFVVGGADGLDATVREAAAAILSFGAATIPHQLVRVLLCEQLYRAMTILDAHPYHRAN